jgi:hypothetical protein
MRESLKAPEVRGTQEPLLPEPFRTVYRAAKGQGATLLYSSDASHVGDVAVVDDPIGEGETLETSMR